MADITFPFNQGYVSSRGRETLKPGELQTATGIYYKPGDPERAHKLQGRSAFDQVDTAAVVKGLALCQFDSGGTDKLVALHGTTLWGATPGATGTFAALTGDSTGLSSSAARMITAHYNDRWYFANGYDRVRVLEPDGTVRTASLFPPTVAPIAASFASGVATTSRTPVDSNVNSGWVDPNNARDSQAGTVNAPTTSAYATALATASAKTCIWHGFASSTATARVLKVVCRLHGDTSVGGVLHQFNQQFNGYKVRIKVEVATDWNGATGTFVAILDETRFNAHPEPFVLLQKPISVDSSLVAVRGYFEYISGNVQSAFRIDDIAIRDGSDATNFTPTDTFWYAFTEYDQDENQESVVGPALGITSTSVAVDASVFTAKNRATLTLPTKVNSRATHFKIYRTFEGGVVFQDLALVGQVLSSETAWTDDFTVPVDEVAEIPYSILRVGSQDAEDGFLPYHRDLAMPTLSYITSWRGALVGLSREFPRALRYSAIGYPESWPEIYAVSSFPLPERDELVAIIPCGDTLLILARGAVLTLTALPQALDGVFTSGEASPLRAAPGCVGVYAATAFSVAGEPRVAWVSTFGIYVSNGHTVARISDDLAWSTEVSVANLGSSVLFWDSELQVLWFAYDSDGGGTNDRFFYAHMLPEHDKGQGISPKWSGPHYGSIYCMTAGLVSSSYRVYSGHVSDGFVYLERGAATDASQSYSSTQVPLIVKTGRTYGSWRDWLAYRGNLRHTAFTAGNTASLVWTWGRDSNGQTGSVTKSSVSLVSQVGTDFFIGRSGEWAEMQLTHTGTGVGALLDCRVDVQVMEKSGRKTA